MFEEDELVAVREALLANEVDRALLVEMVRQHYAAGLADSTFRSEAKFVAGVLKRRSLRLRLVEALLLRALGRDQA
jgi:hypothetical protein